MSVRIRPLTLRKSGILTSLDVSFKIITIISQRDFLKAVLYTVSISNYGITVCRGFGLCFISSFCISPE